MEAWQLDKIKLIFKIEELKIPVMELREGAVWETVGVDAAPTEPDSHFLNTIEDYRYNRFLYIGNISTL